MKVIAAGNAKNGFGFLLDTARAEPVIIQKHGRPVAVVLSVEEYERLKARDEAAPNPTDALMVATTGGDPEPRVAITKGA